jgi:hypothetical protein
MQLILLNCTPKLKQFGIDPSSEGWEVLLENKLKEYVTLEGWNYDYISDTLRVLPVDGTTIDTTILEIGDAGGVEL